MSDVDQEVLSVMARLIITDKEAAHLLQRMWRDRARLVTLMEDIAMWDSRHAEALSVKRVLAMVEAEMDQMDV